jgi:hypothetical protein
MGGRAENEGFAMTRPAGSYYVIGYGGTLDIPTLDVISTEPQHHRQHRRHLQRAGRSAREARQRA